MRNCLNIPALLAVLAMLLAAGCDRGDSFTLSSETDESFYRQGQQLSKQGRNQEALNAYLKVIAKRDDTAPESHLEVGLILLRHVKDPIAAIYHFRKYLELQPNSRQAVYVRGLIDTSKREFARTLPATPLESQADQLEKQDQIDRLLRENDQLKAELTALRGGVTAPPVRSRAALENAGAGAAMITLQTTPAESSPPAAADESPVTYAPLPSGPVEEDPVVPAGPALTKPARPTTKPATTFGRPTTANSGRTHTVAKGDTLFSLAQKYYGSRSKWREIYAANRDVMPNETALKPGMQLKIP
ncbi:MAG: Nucleoid-associated protein YgaU [Verrucomicrobia bacterium]|nr:MAG: Nucleoid-associated protein YgaU [Verrucomicrobiota bacterium]